MLKNYFITAIRNLKREKAYAILNIAGLALGIGCALAIYEIISYETSYDKHNEHYENIYRIVREKQLSIGLNYNEGVPHPLRHALESDFPDLIGALTHYNYGGMISINHGEGNVTRYQEEDGVVFAEQDIFDVFTFKAIAGSLEESLVDPNSTVLCSSLAQKYFGLGPTTVHMALGKTINLENSIDLKVTAVIEDLPATTDVPFKIMINYDAQEFANPYFQGGKRWNSNSSSTNCYVRLNANQKVEDLTNQFPSFMDKYSGENTSDKERYVLQPLSDLHYNTNYDNYSGSQVSHDVLLTLAIIGLFLIITAAINFINLATAQAVKRSKEVGIRKAIGGNKLQLVMQFLSETVMITVLAGFVSLVIGELLFVYLEDIIGYKLTLNIFSNLGTMVFLLSLVIGVGLLSGFYPAMIMSTMDPVLALKNNLNSKFGTGFLSLRRVLVIVQFGISQMLIIGTIVVSAQLDYFLAKDLGFNTDAILTTGLPENDPVILKRLKNQLLEHRDIEFVSCNLSSPLGNSNSHANIHHKSLSDDEEYRVNFKVVDEDYFELFGIEVIAGRALTVRDSANRILVNRKVAELLGFNNPNDALGEKITGWRGESHIIGVVENFHTQSLRNDMDYVVMISDPNIFYELDVKINTEGKSLSQINETVAFIKETWLGVFPDYLYDYEFYDEQLAERYSDEEYMSQLFTLFALIAIFIGCLGLYGLIAYVANQKTKEIGVRKVLGASMWSIVKIFSTEMLGLVIVSFLITAPISYYIMDLWLADFAYRIPISPLYFVIAALAGMFIAVMTVGYKSVSAALANPIMSLRDE